ncbi:MAG: ferrous iron transport protein B [Candidatus Sericytochromatia bacterium]|nr:ferrous iron transport protein B [Candidatus Sericytochromatia bacterium]
MTEIITRAFKIAFAGNPNVGKSALINALAQTRLKVGNWPGVTVEKKEARMVYQEQLLHLVDLPGTYSLSPFTIEEQICRDFLLVEKPDLIVNVIDTSNLQKSLYLTLQLIEMGIPMLIALNMWDEFEARGYQLDIPAFSAALGVPVVATVGPTGLGCEDLKEQMLAAARQAQVPQRVPYPATVEKELEHLVKTIQRERYAEGVPLHWLALKLLEADNYSLQKIQALHGVDASQVAASHRQSLQSFYPDLDQSLSQHRQHFIAELVARVLQPPAEAPPDMTDRVDRLLLNEWTGIPAFLLILFGVFKLTFDISTPFIDWIDGFFNGFVARWVGLGLESLGAPVLLISLLQEGVLGGAGLVLTFVPLLMCLYLLLALLEESGYMARAAFLMDRFMYRFGLHGKAFVPLLVGFGCNVPAVYASRVLDNETDRKMTVAVMSFMSCGAKLPIYALFTAVFFRQYQAFVILGLYLLGIAVAIAWAVILRKTRFKADIPAFIMELPPYRIPTLRMLWGSIWLKTRSFIKQAGTVIAISMILLWSLVNLPYGVPPERTVLGYSARVMAPVFLPQGFGQHWEAVAAVLPGFMAKEMVVGTLGVVLSVQSEAETPAEPGFAPELMAQLVAFKDAFVAAGAAALGNLMPTPLMLEDDIESSLSAAVRQTFTPLSALAFMVFNLLLLSCISVVGAVVHEFGRQYMGFVLLITTGTAYVVSMLVYQLGRILGWS